MVRKKIIKAKSKIEEVLEVLQVMEERLADFEKENARDHERIRNLMR